MEMKIKHKISKLGNKVDIGESIESVVIFCLYNNQNWVVNTYKFKFKTFN